MYRRQIIFLALTFSLAFSAAIGQLKNISVSLGGNYPFINTVSTTSSGTPTIPSSVGFYNILYNQPITIQQESKGQMGFAANGSFDYFISPKFFVSSGLSLDYLRFERSTKVTLGQAPEFNFDTPGYVGSPFGSIVPYNYDGIWGIDTTDTSLGRLRFSDLNNSSLNMAGQKVTTFYISIPVTIGTAFFKERLIVRTGINVSYMIAATTMKQGFNYQYFGNNFRTLNANWVVGTPGSTTQPNTTQLSDYIYEYKDKGTDGFQTLQVSTILKTTYMVTKRWGIDFTSQFYFSPIYSGSEQTNKARFKTFSLGASYRLK